MTDALLVIRELVELKDMHDRVERHQHGVAEFRSETEALAYEAEYCRRKPAAWKAARAFVAQSDAPAPPHEHKRDISKDRGDDIFCACGEQLPRVTPLPADAPTFTLPRDSDALIAHIHAAEDAAAPARDALVDTDTYWDHKHRCASASLPERLRKEARDMYAGTSGAGTAALLDEAAAALAQRDVPRAEPVLKGCATCGASLAGHLAWCSKCVEIAPGWKVVPDDAAPPERSAAQRDDDARMLDWLETMSVDVWLLVHGGIEELFRNSPNDNGTLRAKIRAAMQEGR